MSEIIVPVPDDLLQTGGPWLDAPARVNQSAWTGKRKVIGLPGIELWSGQVEIADVATEVELRPWRAFLYALRGPVNWFKWHLPCNQHAGDRPTVAVGATAGYVIYFEGLAPSATILKAGQYMTVPLPSGYDRAVCLTADVVSTAGGLATATFEPALGEVPVFGVTVETKNPFIRMSPVESKQGFNMSNGVSGTSFEVSEAR